MKDSRSAKGRTFPAPARYRAYVGNACREQDFDVLVVWETVRAFKIKAIVRTKMVGIDQWLEPRETALVSKRSIIFTDAP